MKSISPSDLTAYALNELPPDAADELSLLLAESPAEAATAEETRAFCELLSTTLATPEAKGGAGLSAEQKQVIAENLPPANVVHKFRWPLWAGAGAAAAVAAWLIWPYAPGKHSEVAVESSTTPGEFLPGGGGGRGSQVATDNPETRSKAAAPSEDRMARSVMPLPAARTSGDTAIAKLGNQIAEKKLEEVDAVAPAPLTAAAASLYATDAKKADAAAAPISGPMVATAPTSDSPRGRREKGLAVEGSLLSDAPPAGGKPAERMSESQPTPEVATAAPTPFAVARPLATYSGAMPGKPADGGTIAQNQPLAKAKASLLDAEMEGDGRGLGRAGVVTGTLSLEAESTRNKEARDYSADLYRSTDELRYRVQPKPGLQPAQPGSESYIAPPENPFKQVAAEPLSTFSIDVDTASYANVRRFLNMGQRPPGEAVRVEELVNYFRYAYPAPEAGKPCSLTADLVVCPWNEYHRLARVALKARVDETRPKANLVFLLDVSGSMNEPNKLPLVKQSLKLLVDKLSENDRVSIVVYAGASGVVLPPTHGENKKAILGAIDNLQPGGSTNGAGGITLAYEMARKEFLKEGVNRVILATDGDFNVGISDREGLQSLIEKEAKSGVFLSVLGYGMGNLKDSTMETLADKGNGNYAYIDSLGEARKVLSEEMSSTLVTVAKDVKIQIEFNPGKVRSYKLLGYENRMLAKEDFNDDKKDAGEMGAGHTVTALYEITPTDAPAEVPPVDPLKYQPVAKAEDKPVARPDSPEIMTVKLRYKAPDADVSQLMELPVMDKNAAVASAPGDFQFATAVAGYGLLLRGSKQVGNLNWEMIRTMAKAGKGEDAEGYRGEFLQLVDKAASAVPLP